MLIASLLILGLASVVVRAYFQANYFLSSAEKPLILNNPLIEASLGLVSTLLGLLAAIGIGIAMPSVWWLGIVAFVGFWNWSLTLWGPILMALNLTTLPDSRGCSTIVLLCQSP